MRFRFFVPLALAAMFAPTGAHASPITQDPCPGTFSAPVVWQHVGSPSDLLENLLFSHGSLFISDQTAGAVLRFDAANKSSTPVTTVSSPGGLVDAPDGGIYIGYGDSVPGAAQRSGAAGVVHLSADLTQRTTYASGMNMVNGVTIDAAGDVFTSNDVDSELTEIPASDPAHPRLLNDTWGTNGLVVTPDGKTLYSAITFDQRSPIEATDLATGAHHTAFQLSAGAASLQPNIYTNGDASQPLVGVKGLDDMTSDGRYLYVVANGMGELLRVDPNDGSSCLIASGLQNPSSVRIAPIESGFDVAGAQRTFFITEFDGAIKQIAQS